VVVVCGIGGVGEKRSVKEGTEGLMVEVGN